MIEIQLRQEEAAASKSAIPTVLKARWKGPEAPNAKGILHSPLAGPPMIAGNRDVLLTAIAKARAWIADLAEGRAASFAEIARREGKVERHIRLLAPLAFGSPQCEPVSTPESPANREKNREFYLKQSSC